MVPKRKAALISTQEPSSPPNKSVPSANGVATEASLKSLYVFKHSRVAETYGVVNRKFYPPEISSERCEQYNRGDIPRPFEVLEKTLLESAHARNRILIGDAVVHWFKRDLRVKDNRPLRIASERAREKGVPLICLFIVSPEDYEAHMTSPPRVDFELRSLAVLKQDLAQLAIPLHVETVNQRICVPDTIIQLCQCWGASHVYCGIEYEVDELRRETKLTQKCLDNGISFTALHDDVVIPPGVLKTGAGKQFSVYSPWFRAWIAHVHANPSLLDVVEVPVQNPDFARSKFKDMFDAQLPDAPKNKSLTSEERRRYGSLWPAGEHEASERLEKFLREKIGTYKDTRNFPAANSTSMLSVHFSSGTLSARSGVAAARAVNRTKKLDGGNPGIAGWISELGWRDFYKHILAHWPFICMNKAFKHSYSDIEWEYSEKNFGKWCKGETGFPIVDAAMRQLNNMGYMHNRCRMIVESFLTKDLLIDWRMGEQYFMKHLIDGDFASNNGGWGFSSSVGVDPQPFWRIFNPLLQSEKFDSNGEYIRKWIPELRGVKGSAVHDPYGRGAGSIASDNGYPQPMLDHKERKAIALTRYKTGLRREA